MNNDTAAREGGLTGLSAQSAFVVRDNNILVY